LRERGICCQLPDREELLRYHQSGKARQQKKKTKPHLCFCPADQKRKKPARAGHKKKKTTYQGRSWKTGRGRTKEGGASVCHRVSFSHMEVGREDGISYYHPDRKKRATAVPVATRKGLNSWGGRGSKKTFWRHRKRSIPPYDPLNYCGEASEPLMVTSGRPDALLLSKASSHRPRDSRAPLRCLLKGGNLPKLNTL